MSDHYSNSDIRDWQNAGLKDFGDYSEKVQYVNQKSDGDCDKGQWFYDDEESLTIYSGRFGNDESPGARAWADVYEDKAEFAAASRDWREKPEWLDEVDEDGLATPEWEYPEWMSQEEQQPEWLDEEDGTI